MRFRCCDMITKIEILANWKGLALVLPGSQILGTLLHLHSNWRSGRRWVISLIYSPPLPAKSSALPVYELTSLVFSCSVRPGQVHHENSHPRPATSTGGMYRRRGTRRLIKWLIGMVIIQLCRPPFGRRYLHPCLVNPDPTPIQ